jgi:tetratricopeptide (TPR) repeat protein
MLDARYQRDQARYQSRRAETSIDFLAQLMRADNGPTGPVRTFHERLESGVAMLKQQYRDDPKFSGRMLVDLGDYYRNDEETERANQLYAQAYELGRQSHDSALMVAAQCSRAYGDAYAGIRKGTAERIQEGERLLTGIRNPDVTLEVTCLAAEAVLDLRLGHYAAADAVLRRAMRIQEDVDGTTQTLAYASLLGDFGNLYFARNQPQEALRVSLLIQDIHERNGRGGTAAGLVARFNVAVALTAMGEIRAALGEREIINQRLAQNGGPANDSVAYPIGYAVALTRMAQPERALQALDGVIDRARHGGNPGWLIQALLRTGDALAQMQRWDEADAVLSEAASLASAESSYANADALAEALCAQIDLARGEAAEARHHRDASLKLAGYHTEKEQPALARALLIASQVSMAQGDREAAERFVRDALAISERVARGANTSADVGEGLLRLAQVRIAAGARSEARAMLERAIQCLSNGLAATHPLTREAQALLDRTLHS